jgi:predicted GNAT family acetyltransferase
MSDRIRDNIEKHRYELEIDGHVAFVVYRRMSSFVILVHTEVPKGLGGRGVGSELARQVLETVRRDGLKVVPQCPFIAAWMKKHPEFNDLLRDPPG